MVVRFLAILELYREGKVELAQAQTFGDIEVAVDGLRPEHGRRRGRPGTRHPGARGAVLRLGRAAHGLGARPGARPRPPSRRSGSATGSQRELEDRGSGLVLRNVAGGWRLYTHPDTAPVVEQFVLSSRQARLTKAALETLAIVAYKQPVTRHQVSGIRGVNSDGVLRALADRGLIEEAGRDEAPGRPVLYAHDARVPRAARPAVARRAAVAGPAARPPSTTDGRSPRPSADDADGTVGSAADLTDRGRTDDGASAADDDPA